MEPGTEYSRNIRVKYTVWDAAKLDDAWCDIIFAMGCYYETQGPICLRSCANTGGCPT